MCGKTTCGEWPENKAKTKSKTRILTGYLFPVPEMAKAFQVLWLCHSPQRNVTSVLVFLALHYCIPSLDQQFCCCTKNSLKKLWLVFSVGFNKWQSCWLPDSCLMNCLSQPGLIKYVFCGFFYLRVLRIEVALSYKDFKAFQATVWFWAVPKRLTSCGLMVFWLLPSTWRLFACCHRHQSPSGHSSEPFQFDFTLLLAYRSVQLWERATFSLQGLSHSFHLIQLTTRWGSALNCDKAPQGSSRILHLSNIVFVMGSPWLIIKHPLNFTWAIKFLLFTTSTFLCSFPCDHWHPLVKLVQSLIMSSNTPSRFSYITAPDNPFTGWLNFGSFTSRKVTFHRF